jgi:hypothetical protein
MPKNLSGSTKSLLEDEQLLPGLCLVGPHLSPALPPHHRELDVIADILQVTEYKKTWLLLSVKLYIYIICR